MLIEGFDSEEKGEYKKLEKDETEKIQINVKKREGMSVSEGKRRSLDRDEEEGESMRRPPEITCSENAKVNSESSIQRGISSMGYSLKKLFSFSDDNDRLSRTASERIARRRANTLAMSSVSAAQLTNLMQKTIYKESYSQMLKPFMPLILSIIWILCGTAFYALYSDFGWAKGFLMSVNVGWAIAWTLPSDPPPSSYFAIASKIVSLIHTLIGAIFQGVAVILMARDLMESNDSWIVVSMKRDEIENVSYKNLWSILKFRVSFYVAKLRVVKWTILLIIFGLLWYTFAHDFNDIAEVFDFLISTLCAGGYTSLSVNSNSAQFIVTALYAVIGIPLFKISLGFILSLIVKKSEEKLMYEKMVAPLTSQEQEFMEDFGIDDGDGTMDYKEYVILMAVRMGSVPPHLVQVIQDRFHMLDRKRCGEIAYSELLLSNHASKEEKIKKFIGEIECVDDTDIIPTKKSKENPRGATIKPLMPDDGNIIVAPCNKIPPSPKVVPVSLSQHECLDVHEYEQQNEDTKKYMRCSASVESLEIINLPDETTTQLRTGDKGDVDDECESIQSIETFDGDVLNNECNDKISTEHQSVKLRSDLDFSEKNELGISDRVAELRTAGTATTPDTPIPTGTTHRTKKTFRTSVSRKQTECNVGSLTAREKEFFDEQEKLRSAQLILQKEKSMSNVSYFLHHFLIPNLGIIGFWIVWLVAGTVFFTIHEDVSVSRGLFISTSTGHGIFWTELKGDVVSNLYSRCHFIIGIGTIAGAMAILAQHLLSQEKDWYSDAVKAKKFEEALKTEGVMDDILALIAYYWPHLKVHCFVIIFIAVGALFAAFSFEEWGTLDCLYFAVSTMTSGGFVSMPDDAPDWCYIFMSIYVSIGVPILSISCGILAHQIASRGSASLKMEKVNAQVTYAELEKMTWFGIEDGSGAIDCQEYVILVLVRIGSLNPEIIPVLQDRFDELDTEKCGKISYETLTKEKLPV